MRKHKKSIASAGYLLDTPLDLGLLMAYFASEHMDPDTCEPTVSRDMLCALYEAAEAEGVNTYNELCALFWRLPEDAQASPGWEWPKAPLMLGQPLTDEERRAVLWWMPQPGECTIIKEVIS